MRSGMAASIDEEATAASKIRNNKHILLVLRGKLMEITKEL